MGKRIILNDLKTYEQKLLERSIVLKQKLEVAPIGNLYILAKPNKDYYYCKTKETLDYLGKSISIDIVKYGGKTLLTKELKTVKAILPKITKCIKILESCEDPDEAINLLPRKVKDIALKYLKQEQEEKESEVVNTFLKVNYAKIDIEGCVYKTISGVRVRSKSEALIADRLFNFKIPFLYEKPITLAKGLIKVPDFTVLNKRTGKVYYWEHYGMMNNAKYLHSFLTKERTYALYGYIAGENMICTYESTDNPLNMEVVDIYIKKYLL